MRLAPTALYLVACGGLTGAGIWAMGWVTCLALLGAVAVHELGHYALFRVAGVPARIFISPFIGFTWPLSTWENDVQRLTIPLWFEDDMDPLPFTGFGYGLMLLAGAGLSLLVAVAMHLAGIVQHDWPEPLGALLFIFWLAMLAMNCINLLVLLPLSDGGKLLLAITGSTRRRWVWAMALAGLLSGAALFWRLAPVNCLLVVGVSIWLIADLVESACEERSQLSYIERLVLAGLWGGIVGISIALLAGNELARVIIADMLS